MSTMTSCCCGDDACGIGLPIVLPWKVQRDDWETATGYVQHDLVLASDGRYYVAKIAHTSGATTQPGVGDDWATVWDLGEPQMRCAWVEIAGLKYKDCMPVFGFRPDDDPTVLRVMRFGSGSFNLNDKGKVIQFPRQVLDQVGDPTGFMDAGWYPGVGTDGCFWLFAGCCGCPQFDPFEATGFGGGRVTPDSYSVGGFFVIHVRESIIEVSIHGGAVWSLSDRALQAQNADCNDVPCSPVFGPNPSVTTSHARYLYFQGAATIPPGGWIGADGVPVSDLVISNDLATDDIGKIIFDDDGNPLVVVAGGEGTVTIKAGAHAVGWETSIGNAMSSAGSVPSPQDCTADDPPLPDPGEPICCGPGGGGGGGGGLIPPWDPPLPPAEYCMLTPCAGAPGFCVGGSVNKNLLCALLGIAPCDPEGLVVLDSLGCCLQLSDCNAAKGGSTTVFGLSLVSGGCAAPECVPPPCQCGACCYEPGTTLTVDYTKETYNCSARTTTTVTGTLQMGECGQFGGSLHHKIVKNWDSPEIPDETTEEDFNEAQVWIDCADETWHWANTGFGTALVPLLDDPASVTKEDCTGFSYNYDAGNPPEFCSDQTEILTLTPSSSAC